MPQQYHLMSHVQRMDDFMDTMSIPLAPVELVAIGAFVWSLLGLWLWLTSMRMMAVPARSFASCSRFSAVHRLG